MNGNGGSISSRIQPDGFLLAMSTDWQVEQASANIGDYLGIDADRCLGRPAADFLPGDAIHALRNRLALLRGTDGIERLFNCELVQGKPTFDTAIHMSDGLVVLEAEPSVGKNDGDVIGTVRAMSEPLDATQGIDELLAAGTRQVRALTGYDRVVVIRFDGHSVGHAVAECARGGIGSILGQQLPPDSFPEAERAAWQRSSMQLASDVDLPGVAITQEHGSAPLDLSLSVLRAPSPAYADHLRRHGAQAALTLAIMVDGRLWGIVACHHHLPRRPSAERRSMAELFVQMFAMRIEIAELRQSLAEAVNSPESISAG